MKAITLLGLVLMLTVSCQHRPATPATAEETLRKQEVRRLVTEANKLWTPPLDTTFIFLDDSEHTSVNDKEIRAKLDSALAIDPTDINVYVGKISYLSACKKFPEVLPVLRQAEKQSTLNAELWAMKAMLEDYFGDSLTAQKDYRSADSAFAIRMEQQTTDSLNYVALRLNRALNKALMTDDFTALEEEEALAQKIYPELWEGLGSEPYGKSKKEFFDKYLTGRKK